MEIIEQALVEALQSPATEQKWQVYGEYRDSGVEWVGMVPRDWEVQRVKFSAPLSTQKLLEKPENLPYIGLENIESRTGRLLIETQPESVDSVVGLFKPGDVLFNKLRPYLAKVVAADFTGVCTTELLVFRLKNDILETKYLFYRFMSEDFIKLVDSFTYGTKMPRANSEQIVNIPIQIPSLPEQRAIATFLDQQTTKIDTLITKKEQLIALLQEKRAALISQAVTRGLNPDVLMKDSGVEWLGMVPEHWNAIRLKRLCLVRRGASPRPIEDPIYFDDNGDYAWVRISDVTASNKYLSITEQKLSSLGKSKSVCLEPGELFLSIAGSVGKPIITQIKCCIHDGFVYFIGVKHNKEFLYYVFLCDQLYKGQGKIGTQLNLNTDTIGNMRIPIPPLEEQKDIVLYLDQQTTKMDTLITGIRKGIEKVKEYRTALISAAVTGKIDVRGELVLEESVEEAEAAD